MVSYCLSNFNTKLHNDRQVLHIMTLLEGSPCRQGHRRGMLGRLKFEILAIIVASHFEWKLDSFLTRNCTDYSFDIKFINTCTLCEMF